MSELGEVNENGLVPMLGSDRIGDFMSIRAGKIFWPFDPRPEDIDVYDIANALAKSCRYGGHGDYFYSVAQHAVIVSQLVPRGFEFEGLHHDDAEAYLTDLPRPIKHSPDMRLYLALEAQLNAVIMPVFGLSPVMSAEVKYIDDNIVGDEAHRLFHPVPEWAKKFPSVGAQFEPIEDWRVARDLYLNRHYELLEKFQ